MLPIGAKEHQHCTVMSCTLFNATPIGIRECTAHHTRTLFSALNRFFHTLPNNFDSIGGKTSFKIQDGGSL
jgi:hypothetical protein